MAPSLQRLDQTAKPDDFDDQKSASAIATSEVDSVDFGTFLEAMLSQIQRIIHGNEGGNWHDDPASVFGGDASLYGLFKGATKETQVDLQDNNVEFVAVGDMALHRKVVVNYSFELPIANDAQVGWFTITHKGGAPGMTHAYDYVDTELDSVEFEVEANGTEIRLKITTDSVGENPKFIYRVSTLKMAT